MTRGREIALATAAALAYVALLVAISAAMGVLGIARNDDWSFIENAFRFHETGIFAVGGWVQMNLIGQLVLAAPFIGVFGESITVLQILGIVAVGVGVLSAYALARTYLALRFAVTIALTTALSPVILVLSASFMTDGFAMAGQVTALALGAYAVSSKRRNSIIWWVLALAIGVWAFSVREFSIVALGALVLLGIASPRFSLSVRIATALVPAACVLAIFTWRSALVTETTTSIVGDVSRITYWGTIPLTVGFLALPALAWVQPIRTLRRFDTPQRVAAAAGVVLVAALVAQAPSATIGNYFGPEVAYTTVLPGTSASLYPIIAWRAILALGAFGAVVALVTTIGLLSRVAGTRMNALRRWADNPGLFLASVYSAGMLLVLLLLPLLTDAPLFDRYFVGVIAVAIGPLLWWAQRSELTRTSAAIPVLALSALAVTGVTAVVAAGRVDATRWALAEQVHQEASIARGNIDGGFDWFRFQSDGIPRPDSWPPRYSWWTLDEDRAVCATLVFDAPPQGDPTTFPDDQTPVLAQRTIRLLFSQQVILAKSGPDQCP